MEKSPLKQLCFQIIELHKCMLKGINMLVTNADEEVTCKPIYYTSLLYHSRFWFQSSQKKEKLNTYHTVTAESETIVKPVQCTDCHQPWARNSENWPVRMTLSTVCWSTFRKHEPKIFLFRKWCHLNKQLLL